MDEVQSPRNQSFAYTSRIDQIWQRFHPQQQANPGWQMLSSLSDEEDHEREEEVSPPVSPDDFPPESPDVSPDFQFSPDEFANYMETMLSQAGSDLTEQIDESEEMDDEGSLSSAEEDSPVPPDYSEEF